ncbi:EscU/YscU/HrcU family type III secretion system export apparatus switch protein [Rhodovulum sulfidophilum]|uniref:Flagellar biosynthesis protein FlhB n=1 Tax=Rhodovulum sulfidophilum TaxID=35806 RepID=A0ABS1RZW8_RHOSU|nr:flagellar type III secretion system protein FlhB [Rhodovulum sulfidophilum]MBL3610479.1 flagellar biosynthesis protein FlhB [Rhodovulum sulfidophilum]MCE8455377.1 flagellar type III secretion system protein FlhB [Rhodovulum sulfidophilum]
MSDEDPGDKQFEPTQKKLDDARRKGEIARSTDINTAAVYAGFALTALALGGTSLIKMGELGAGMIGQADRLAPLLLEGHGSAPVGGLMAQFGLVILPWLAIPALAALASVLAQRSLVVAPEKLLPKLSRINPIETAKNKFGRSGLFEFTKSTVKLALYTILLALYLSHHVEEMLGTMYLSPAMAAAKLVRMSAEFLTVVVAIAASIGVVDYLWQIAEHRRRHRMSLEELKEEIKQSEGDPHIKQQRRQRAMDIATNRMLRDVPDADVVIVNPTHYAVALKWDRARRGAPFCLAKGVDEVAARIREVAVEAGVPMRSDPPTARAIYGSVEIGDEIKPEHYKAVAAAIRFAEEMRTRAKGL